MNKVFSIVLLVAGIALIIMGVQGTNSFNSDVSRFFTGAPTDKAMWMLFGGIIAAAAGFAMTFRGSRNN
jgi:hypothetical protein